MAKKQPKMAGKQKSAAKQEKEDRSLFRHLMKVLAATVLLVVFVLMAGLLVFLLVPPRQPAKESRPAVHMTGTDGQVFEIYPQVKKTPLPAPDRPAETAVLERTSRLPRVAIIIDDLGYDKKIADRFIALGPGLTVSLLPGSPHVEEIATEAHRAGNEIMMHQPLEPVEYPAVDPGPGVLLTDMPPDALLRQLRQNIAGIPYVKGVNNHMGSKLTTESAQLYQIFSVLKKQGLFFIDSATTDKSLCAPSAQKLQVPFARRDVFLDNSLSTADIRHQLNRLVDIAVRKGKAIGIGHPHPETIRVLEQQWPALNERVQLVPASALTEGGGDH